MFDAIAAVVDAKARPLTGDDDRSAGRAAGRGAGRGVRLRPRPRRRVPECGGHRPHLNVLIRLEDLENRARAACLDFGGTVSPESLRMLCCDAAVVPIVLNGKGQPLDVGRVTRTIPDGLRRAVAARDRGCAHPGCGRRPPGAKCHHIRSGSGRGDEAVDNLVMLCRRTTGRSIPRNGSCGSATDSRVHPAAMDGPRATTAKTSVATPGCSTVTVGAQRCRTLLSSPTGGVVDG